jgi:diacylglycerol kinase family enzyme
MWGYRKVNLFFPGVFSSAKNSRFITSAGGGVGARVIKRLFKAREKKSGKKSFFYRTSFV